MGLGRVCIRASLLERIASNNNRVGERVSKSQLNLRGCGNQHVGLSQAENHLHRVDESYGLVLQARRKRQGAARTMGVLVVNIAGWWRVALALKDAYELDWQISGY